jgi:hypothetical protein
MNLERTKLHILQKKTDLSDRARSGISLHCHTEHSKEMLDFIPHYAQQLPIISFFWKREFAKYRERYEREMDFSTAYWSPPLTGQMVYDIEKGQINKTGLDAFVSLTDHDNIAANLAVADERGHSSVPVSLEWTVPFEFGFFHVGVHNLPKDRAEEITKTLLDYTFDKTRHTAEHLDELLVMLCDIPQVLVILNHPLWDIEMAGKERHRLLLQNFLRRHGRWIHALEINGFRKWSENKAVIEIAESYGIPVATGGDRHGCRPNTVINLTDARTFDEFVDEIRVDKKSQVVFMPEYEQPLHSRQLASFAEILSTYPDFPEHRRRWFDRVFYDLGDGIGVASLSERGWNKTKRVWLRAAIWTLGILGSPAARPIFRAVRHKRDRVPRNADFTRFEIPSMEDLPAEFSSRPV